MKLSPIESKESILDLVWRAIKCFSTAALILITCTLTAYLLSKLGKLIYHMFGLIL